MSTGIRLTDKDTSPTVDALVGIRTDPTAKVTPIAFSDLEEQLLGGAVGDAINAAADLRPTISLDLATTGNVTLSGEQTVDGSLTSASKVLVRTNTDAKQNGPYVTALGAWTRLSDFDTGAELFGQTFFIKGGTANANKSYTLQNTAVPTVGSTNLVYDVTQQPNTAKPGALDALRANAAAVTAAGTLNLEAATGEYVPVNGNTGISTVTLAANHERFAVFTGGPLITVGASLIGDNGGQNVQIEPGDIVWFRGEAGGVVRFRTYRAVPYNSDNASDGILYAVVDRRGRAALAVHEDGSINAGPASYFPAIETTDDDTVAYAVTDVRGRVVFAIHSDGSIHTSGVSLYPNGQSSQPASLDIYFAPVLYGIAGEEVTVDIENVLFQRSDGNLVRGYASGDDMSGYQRQAREQLVLRPDKMGATGRLTIRAATDLADLFGEVPLTIKSAAKNPVSGGTQTILGFGDSIWHRGAAGWLKKWLTDFGYTPTFIGTLDGENAAGYTTGLKGEGKPGHQLRDFTYSVTNRVAPLAPGSESTYNGLPTDSGSPGTSKRTTNTMLRSQSLSPVDGGSVDPADVRNGYYLDFQFYVQRHGLATPTMLALQPGTNDLTTMTSGVQAAFYVDLLTIARRWKAAYPSAPIIYFLPPTGFATDRNPLWTANYTEAVRGILHARNDAVALGINMIAVPTWANVSSAADFDLTAYPQTPDPNLGSVIRSMPDAVHVTGAGRSSMFKHVSYAIACAATGI